MIEKIKPLRKSQYAPDDAKESGHVHCAHPALAGPDAACKLCRIEVDKLTVYILRNTTYLEEVSELHTTLEVPKSLLLVSREVHSDFLLVDCVNY